MVSSGSTPRIGIYNLFPSTGGGAEKRTAAMAERLSRDFEVSWIVGEACSLRDLEKYFAMDLSRVKVEVLRLPVQHALRRALQSKWGALARRARGDRFLYHMKRALGPTYRSQVRGLGLDLFINNQWSSVLRCPAPRGVYMCMFPQERRGELPRDPSRNYFSQAYAALGNRLFGMTDAVLDSYHAITANSAYTAGWIERWWGRTATVVYSACESMAPRVGKERVPKEKMILHVGRFVNQRRKDYKHQGTLLEVFRGMTALQRDGWQLHFVGTLPADARSREIAAELTAAAAGLPVFFHFTADFETLRGLYRRAAIYWHATGFGSSPETHPASQEHFGMTIVEAMSAGSVPVVIDSGGLRETVRHGHNGFLWKDLGELENFTSTLATDAALLENFRERAIEGSRAFTREAFADRVEALVRSLLKV